MKTTISTFKRGDKTIISFGVCHIGTENYFKEIQTRLDSISKKGGVVLYEGVGNKKGVKDKEMDIVTNAHKMFSEILGYKFQSKCLNYSDSWIKSDISSDHLKFIYGKSLFNLSKIDDDKIKLLSDTLKGSKFIRGILEFVINNVSFFSAFTSKKNHIVTIDYRNNNVLSDCFEQLKDNDTVCIFYGQAHFKGINKFLKKVGFVKSKTDKLYPFK